MPRLGRRRPGTNRSKSTSHLPLNVKVPDPANQQTLQSPSYHTALTATEMTPLTTTATAGWKKLLWLKQPYEDNYTDSSFLSQLKRNSTVVRYSYKKLVSDFSLVVLHLSLIMSIIVVFYGIYKLGWNPIKPVILSSTLTVIGFVFYVVMLNIRRNDELIELQQFKIRQLYALSSNSNITTNTNISININDRDVDADTIGDVGSGVNDYRDGDGDVEEKRDADADSDNDAALNSKSGLGLSSNLDLDLDLDFNLNLDEYLTEPSPPNFFETSKSSLLIILYLLTLSPVLKSLTNSTSSDSIWALSAWLCLLNVMFNDYQIDFPRVSTREKYQHWKKIFLNNISIQHAYYLSSPNTTRSPSPSREREREMYQSQQHHPQPQHIHHSTATTELFDQPLKPTNFSKNIAVSNAIVLASRLDSNAAAFSFILFCVETCGLFPIFNNFTRRCGLHGFHLFQTIFIILTVDCLVWYLFGIGWVLVWIALHVMIVFVGPWYFLVLQKYKNELQGPWDAAKPVFKSI